MKNISNSIFEYAALKSQLWNMYFRQLVTDIRACEPLDSFEEIDLRLFKSLVCYPYGITLTDGFVYGVTPVDDIIIIPKGDNESISLMIGKLSEDSNKYWNTQEDYEASGAQFRFIEFFDWDKYGEINCSLVRVVIDRFPDEPGYVDREAIVDIDYIEVINTEKSARRMR